MTNTSQIGWPIPLEGVSVDGQLVAGQASVAYIDATTEGILAPSSALIDVYGAIPGSKQLDSTHFACRAIPAAACHSVWEAGRIR